MRSIQSRLIHFRLEAGSSPLSCLKNVLLKRTLSLCKIIGAPPDLNSDIGVKRASNGARG